MDRKDFHRFVKEGFEPLLKRHGFKRKSTLLFEREDIGVRQVVSFLLDGVRFVPRLAVVLASFYDAGELGVTLAEDLPGLEGKDPSSWWRLSSSEEERRMIAADVGARLESVGLAWLDGHRSLNSVIKKLESQKYREPGADASGVQAAMTQLAEAGFRPRTLEIASVESGSQSGVKPEVAKHLSYCYELRGDWRDALHAWREYCTIFPPSDKSDFLRKIGQRLEYLTEKASGVRSS